MGTLALVEPTTEKLTALSYIGGSLGEVQAETICRVLRTAGRGRMPVVSFIESAGARLQEGVAALAGYGRIFNENVALSGQVPQISVICGPSAGGGSYSPALTDFVVMTKQASMFLTGPSVVKEVMGEDVDTATLGGAEIHDRNGVCQLGADSDIDAVWLVRELLDHLPQHADEAARLKPVIAPAEGPSDRAVPDAKRKVYDVRDVVRTLVDGGRLLEISPRWARNMLTGFARIDGRTVGIVANQPRYLGGVLDAQAATKGARFVRTCDLYGIALVDLVHRRAIKAADDPGAERIRLAADYERDCLTAQSAAREGVVDEIVEPAHTRARLASALRILDGAPRTASANRNIPL